MDPPVGSKYVHDLSEPSCPVSEATRLGVGPFSACMRAVASPEAVSWNQRYGFTRHTTATHNLRVVRGPLHVEDGVAVCAPEPPLAIPEHPYRLVRVHYAHAALFGSNGDEAPAGAPFRFLCRVGLGSVRERHGEGRGVVARVVPWMK